MKPSRLSQDLRRLASYIDKTDKPSLSRVSSRLGRLVKAAEGEDPEYNPESVEGLIDDFGEIKLQGPFKPMMTMYEHWLDVEGVITNPEMLKLLGLGDPTECTAFTLWMEIGWYHEPADPSVGIPSDSVEMEEFQFEYISRSDDKNNAIFLENEIDRGEVTERFKHDIKASKNDLAKQIEKIHSEY